MYISIDNVHYTTTDLLNMTVINNNNAYIILQYNQEYVIPLSRYMNHNFLE